MGIMLSLEARLTWFGFRFKLDYLAFTLWYSPIHSTQSSYTRLGQP